MTKQFGGNNYSFFMIAAAVVRQPYNPTGQFLPRVVGLPHVAAATHINKNITISKKYCIFTADFKVKSRSVMPRLAVENLRNILNVTQESMIASRISVGCLLFLVTRFSQDPQLKKWYISATLLIIKCSSRRWRAQQNKNEENLINRSAGFVRNGGVCTKGCHGQG